MKAYGLRPNRPQTGDGFFRNLHLRHNLDDTHYTPEKKSPAKTRWLRGIAPHLQLAIVRLTSDNAKGQKRTGKVSLSNTATVKALEKIGIQNRWASCPDIIQLLELETSFIKGDYIKQANRLEFKQVQKIGYYFDGRNEPRKTAVAYSLAFRLLKETPQPRHIT
ncbi:unnamed protein product [Rotaria sp. Silwood2]|nr:unnamed protein product [Rotaria sp. Silwood2]CAF3045486.1 unnamed protein product [Rotaria sp. Silwood2]CAF3385661.1 unnamed protein product [Rotaria sp. Silwood2]CAF4359534.1 unnamed protein product [Rotaria sp. Silwood2]CAF4362431.1 unnamed protein product [Rotaria sp. Silwood2]